MADATDTIVAIATPPGRGGVAIIRMSGGRSRELLQQVIRQEIEPRHASYARFHDRHGAVLDRGIALYFPAPNSFTGEEVVELQAHGSPVVLGLLIDDLLVAGARMARPGEFTERAFLNGKLDLTQAEAVADLINASSEHAARSAARSLEGSFAASINALRQDLVRIQVRVEAQMDFPEETSSVAMDMRPALAELLQQSSELLHLAERSNRIQEGLQIAIIGRPNTGKSSLLNRLSGRDSAIVSEHAGTTRDPVSEFLQIGGIAVKLIDTAGLRSTSDPVETEGIARTWRAVEQADLIFIVIDATRFEPAQDLAPLQKLPKTAAALIFNKIDLLDDVPGTVTEHNPPTIRLSAKSGAGMQLLEAFVHQHAGLPTLHDAPFSARRRHVLALQQVCECLQALTEGLGGLSMAEELIAERLRWAQQQLSAITGDFTTEDLLGEIFQTFCLGK